MKLEQPSTDALPPRVRRIVAEMERQQTLGWVVIAGKLSAGILLSFIGPVIAALIHSVIIWDPAMGWMWMVAKLILMWTAILVPILLVLARWLSGDFAQDALGGESAPSSYGEAELLGAKGTWVFFTELALLGPRLLWSVWDTLTGRSKLSPEDQLIAARIVSELLDRQGAVPVRELIKHDRSIHQVSRSVRHLARLDWVDTSQRRDRVWLRSPVRQRLLNLR